MVGIDPVEEAMLRAVYEAPRDDAPRHVYADWLLEQGDPRGDLIALQLDRIAKTKRLGLDEVLLLVRHRHRWATMLGPVAQVVDPVGFLYRRGFPAEGRIATRVNDEATRRAIGHEAWSTFEVLHVPHERNLSLALLTHPVMRALDRLVLHGTPDLTVERSLAPVPVSWIPSRP